jgi:tRNA dimethylallyltransferase
VDDWAHLATDEIKSAWENDQTPILVGGTGFYIKSLLEGLSPIPSFESSKKILKGAALQKAYKYLESIDPVIGVKIQPNDAQRVQRAVEVYENTGKPLSYWQSIPKESLLETLDFEYKVDRILILPKRDANVEKADLRFNKMLELGVVDEVEQFMYQNIPITHTIYKAIGLNEIIEYIKGYLSKNEMIEKAVTKTAQYIKRQTTWFKHQYNADQVIE